MFSGVSRGIPSFGDLAWKRPVNFVTDVSLTWDFPVPTRSPVGAPVPGQTLTKNGNGALADEPPMLGQVLSVGDRLLVAVTDPGIWIVTDLGSAGTPWILTRATDGDTTAKLINGAITTSDEFALDGVPFTAARAFFAYDGTTWQLLPNVAAQFSVLGDAYFGALGAVDPAVDVNGRLVADTLQTEGTLIVESTGYITGGIGPIVRVYTSNATWNKPTGLHHIIVECVGGGGGGGGAGQPTSSTQSAAGAGGGGGGYARKLFLASALPSSCSVTRGAGGAGNSAAAGSNGAASTFAGSGITTVSGGGGAGGAAMAPTSGVAHSLAGAGGTSTGGDVNMQGSDGGNGDVVQDGNGSASNTGTGGASFLGGSARGRTSSGNGDGGNQYGGGGSGGLNANSQATNRSGGAGANGVVIVTEYYAP